MPKERYIGVRALRARLAAVLKDVSERSGAYVVERDGHPVAAVVPLDLYRRVAPSASLPAGRAERVAEPAVGPYDVLLALAGTMPGEHTDVARHKQRHLADIYATKKTRRG